MSGTILISRNSYDILLNGRFFRGWTGKILSPRPRGLTIYPTSLPSRSASLLRPYLITQGGGTMNRVKGFLRYPFRCAAGMAMLLALFLGLSPLHNTPTANALGSCQLNSAKGNIKHVIYVQFDNTHFTRDNPTSLTGVYGDRHGVPVANSFRYFNPDGTSNPGVSFAYWTDPLFDPSTSTPTDTTFNMLTAAGKNAPAPWVPFTRAGCNVGAVATANTILENTAVDVAKVFGSGSTQATEASTNPVKAQADFVGIGIHCAQGNALCSSANTGQSDLLPQEPGGYSGYMGLFGHEYVAPQISPSLPMKDLFGNTIQDPNGNLGFPGFDGMSAAVSLAYVAGMQEHGVPITYAYISDAHDKHPSGPSYGPGQSGYVAALQAYNQA